ncbi:hypothetical protein BDY19DRAFT_989320 [Irpex rosettiformis]|uniref:Uncharacterized protein n=1 Tax=Irpex rosettiformis TaxID=378272 RepID=A0ACB8UHE7_9APHY|nr:hypothetical protein BDY19DRAFT_989320 [Irpex rosettiformis]
MYDHPPSSTQPSPCPSIVGLPSSSAPAKPHRTHSPIPHLSVSTLLPHHHQFSGTTCSRQYSPNSKQSDASRLLDPSYASSSSVNVGPSRAYVDHSGDLHDPDYRHFPVLPTHKKRVNSPARRSSTNSNAKRRSTSVNPTLYASSISSSTRRASSGSTIAAMNDRYSTYPLVARPEWERDWATEVELDDDDDDIVGDDDSQDVHSPFYSGTPSSSVSSPRRMSLPPSLFVHHSASVLYSEPVPAMTFSTTSSPVDSLDEEPEVQPQMYQYVDDLEPSPKQRAQSLLRRMKRSSSANDVLNQPMEKFESPEEHELDCAQEESPCDEPSKEQIEQVPSCANGLRQHWRALTLRLRFGVFHAKRRLSVSPITKRRKTV